MLYIGVAAQIERLLLPYLSNFRDGLFGHLCHSEIMKGTITNHTRVTLGAPHTIGRGGWRQHWLRCLLSHTGMIVVKDKGRLIVRVLNATDAHIAGTEIAVIHIGGSNSSCISDGCANPR